MFHCHVNVIRSEGHQMNGNKYEKREISSTATDTYHQNVIDACSCFAHTIVPLFGQTPRVTDESNDQMNKSAKTTTRQEANAEVIGTSNEQGEPLSPP